MEIREANLTDIPEIVSLLRISLGEKLLPKSADYWRWKHINNPFGESPVIIAKDDGKIVGVRAFMRWAWQSETGTVEAVRAVDTATHPSHQGKGIFSKLTKRLLTYCEQKGCMLVYNTPNSKSLPGYLKMGWVKAGKYPISVRLVRPITISRNILRNPGDQVEEPVNDSVSYYLSHSELSELLIAHRRQNAMNFCTVHTVESLKWRYADVPIGNYFAAGAETVRRLEFIFFYRIKRSRFGKELRITDLFLNVGCSIETIRALLGEKIKVHKCDYVTFGLGSKDLLNGFFSFTGLRVGPIVTVRKIGSVDLSYFTGFSRWQPSLGDLELF